VVWVAAKQMADPEVGVIAAAIAALSPLLLYYSNEVKPYGTDALVAAGLSSPRSGCWMPPLIAGDG
jgi:hypothetical protein